MKKGSFIAIYGINNLGKSTQVALLVEKLKQIGVDVISLKYALYDLEPSGPILNDYLRKGNPYKLSHREFKIFHAMNRTQNDANIRSMIESGKTVIVEDYTGTSIAWGVGSGVDKEFIEKINSHLLEPDMAILLDGKRFTDGIEEGHKHESDNDLTEKVRQVHLELAREQGWRPVNANQSREEVHEQIMKLYHTTFSKGPSALDVASTRV